MGKRELLLIIGFIAVGAGVYQLTAPADHPGESVFGAGRRILDDIRREVRGRPARAEITTNTNHPVPAGIRELRVTMRNTPVIVTGEEERSDIGTELWVTSNGVDEAEARSLAGKAELTVEPAGPTMTVSLSFPEQGSQRAKLHVRVPSHMLVHFAQTNAGVQISGVEGVELEAARGETIIRKITGKVTVTHRGGELTVEQAGSVRLETRGSELRLTGVDGDASLEIVSGDVRARRLHGPVEIDAEHADLTLEELEDADGPFRVTAFEGSVIVRGLRTDARIDGNDSEIEVAMDEAASVAIFNRGERIQFTPPADGFMLDAVADGGEITVPAALESQVTVSGKTDGEEKEQRASGEVRGGGPTITLRATRGDIRINPRESN